MGTVDVVKFALVTRALLLALVLLWRVLGSPYDTSALLNPPCLSSRHLQREAAPPLLFKLSQALEKSIVWDGVYYIRIAECGYEYEQTFAFLPIFPFCVRIIANTVLSGFIPLVGYRATLGLSGLLFNNVVFVLSAVLFYKVTCIVLKDEKLSYLSTAIFCLNPASIFYASIYSESLFSLLTFAGLREFLRGSHWMSACLFALSGGVRSNGVMHGGFLLFHAMQEIFKVVMQRRFKMAVEIICVAASQTAIVLLPFVAFQTFGFMKLCQKETNGGGKIYSRPWCNGRLPYMYGYVQSNYWDVGFLRYFQKKQLPNFLLASPMLCLAVWSILYFVKHRPIQFCTLGLCEEFADELPPMDEVKHSKSKLAVESAPVTSEDFVLKRRRHGQLQMNGDENDRLTYNKRVSASVVNAAHGGGYFTPLNIPFLIEMAVMVLVACFVMHVQVATRFLSICAPIYWFAAHQIHHQGKSRFAHIVWSTFLFYIFLGSLLFVNFYPFT